MGIFSKKDKRYIHKIEIRLHNREGEDKDQYFFVDLAPDESYKIISVGGDLHIYNALGDIKKRFNWQAGHTVEYTFNYRPLEWYDDPNREE